MSAADFPRDRWKRPLVVPPGGGKPVAYSRFSSWGAVLEDRFNLERWGQRMVALGIAHHEHLRAQVAATPVEDKSRIDKLCEEAKKLAGSETGSGLGTALHEFTARVDTGAMDLSKIIDPYRADVAAYRATLAEHGYEIVPELVEVQLVHDELRLAGTTDRFFRRPDGRLVCADVKSGKEIWDNPLGYVVQLAAYATSVLYDVATGERRPVGDVDTTVGYLVHIPVGRGECTFHEVDLVAGIELARLAGTVRAAQKRRDLVRVARPTERTVDRDTGEITTLEPVLATAVRINWVRDRIVALRDLGAAIDWPDGLVTPKAALAGATVTDEDVEAMCAVVADAERTAQAPFPPEDPATPEPERAEPPAARSGSSTPKPDEGATLTDTERSELRAWVAGHCTAPDVVELVNRVAREGGRDLVVPAWPSVRRRALAMALVRLAGHGEEVLRAACALVIADAAQPAVSIGSALAAMTIEEATRLLGVAEALDARELVLGYAADGAAALVSAA